MVFVEVFLYLLMHGATPSFRLVTAERKFLLALLKELVYSH